MWVCRTWHRVGPRCIPTQTGHSVDSMSPPRNFTARAARWSASHRKAAVLSWLAFVFVAFALGNAAGTVTLKSQDQGNGESRAANQVLASSSRASAPVRWC